MRWDPLNAKLLCFSCHRWWHENPVDAVMWVEVYLGPESYKLLQARASKPTHFSRSDIQFIEEDLKRQIKAIEDEGLV